MVNYIKSAPDVSTKRRYREINKKLSEISSKLKKKVGDKIDVDGLIDYETKKQKVLFGSLKKEIAKAKGGNVNFLYPSKEQIKTAALFKPVTEGFTYDSYLNGIQEGFYNIWDSHVRTGYLTGIPTKDIVDSVMGGISKETKLKNPGIMQSLRNSVYGNTRTVLQSFANETRNRIMEENEQYFGDGESDYKYEYLATLDNRTCMVCGSLDGKLYKKIEDAPSLPQHRGCRCLLVPYFNIEGDTRASKKGYVDSDTTFENWLKEQDEHTQLDVLGRTRYELFRRGEPIKMFVDNGNVLDLKDLNERLLNEKKIDIKEYLSHNVREPDITKLSDHVNKRVKERIVNYDGIFDALSNPLYVGDVREKDGAYLVIGSKASVGVSAFDGTITTSWKTGKGALAKIKKGKMK